MHFVQVFCIALTAVKLASSGGLLDKAPGKNDRWNTTKNNKTPGGWDSENGSKMERKFPPRPYKFSFEAPDTGSTHYRLEQGDANGNVHGQYGYVDDQGLFRHVEYLADDSGFRANIKTNEPGIDGKENPADVFISAQPPPDSLLKKYNRSSCFGDGKNGSNPTHIFPGFKDGKFSGIGRFKGDNSGNAHKISGRHEKGSGFSDHKNWESIHNTRIKRGKGFKVNHYNNKGDVNGFLAKYGQGTGSVSHDKRGNHYIIKEVPDKGFGIGHTNDTGSVHGAKKGQVDVGNNKYSGIGFHGNNGIGHNMKGGFVKGIRMPFHGNNGGFYNNREGQRAKYGFHRLRANGHIIKERLLGLLKIGGLRFSNFVAGIPRNSYG